MSAFLDRLSDEALVSALRAEFAGSEHTDFTDPDDMFDALAADVGHERAETVWNRACAVDGPAVAVQS
ncbi:hypothetical protein [Frankia sp. AgW1.1]|uniref:hypothetical protein n=1 Tax=Frankia sp. AgW1.1 TaxID=1836971 RepID=UPI0019312AB4|nr:hypothetical protein [Frankia sp. AgW1.1]MBL7487033.1 hypothetical protein [Frankia sp. AgW1.1]